MNHPILFTDKSKCSGCAACCNICPRDAIMMKVDECGCYYPEIDSNRCIGCNLCTTACNYQNSKPSGTVISTYVAISLDPAIRSSSSSGGVFSSIAEQIIINNGVVYGCTMERTGDDYEIKHVRISHVSELPKLQGSKYSQSLIADVFKYVKEDIMEGKSVLFSGTPCQIDGLKGYLGKIPANNLYTIDILCHGVPGTGLINSYVHYLEKKNKIKIIDMKFRDKTLGWASKGFITYIKSGKTKKLLFSPHTSSFYRLFLDSAIFRENCYTCKYACDQRVGDLTIGDYWGIETAHPELMSEWNQKLGISCILVNNEKGLDLLEKFGGNLLLKSSELSKIKMKNPILTRPCKDNKDRVLIRSLLKEQGYKAVDKWWKKKQGMKRYLFLLKDKIRYFK